MLAFYTLGDFVSVAITNLYLWQLTNDFQKILFYNVFVFSGMAIGGLLASILGAKIGNKLIFTLAMMLYAVQFGILLFTGSHVASYIILLGIISGFAIGSESYAYNVIVQEITAAGGREKFFGTKTSMMNTIILIGVPMLTFITTQVHSYVPIFSIAFVLVIIVAFLATRLVLLQQTTSFHLMSTKNVIAKFPDIKNYLLAKYLFGIQNGLFWVVLGIVTLQFVGDLFRWGIFSTCLTFIAIAAAYFYGKKATVHGEKYPAVIGAYAFALVTLFLATNWNFTTFIIYQVVLVILTVIMSVSFDSFMATIIEEDSETASLRNELNGIGEFALNLGRFTPIFLLLLLHISFDNNLYLRIAFLVVAPLPLFIMSALKKTKAFM